MPLISFDTPWKQQETSGHFGEDLLFSENPQFFAVLNRTFPPDSSFQNICRKNIKIFEYASIWIQVNLGVATKY